ncbi:hypothetical protein GH5_08130 [Leishmania sp. Ghana 2012 LV757]|uniref:hypothetical protein n=1 Tax=Leishmania sp. Ghana 2012 LV757 TaxID=2803181 RepID=UPI001B54E04D|nr:hypothetical protein GH5_08130 [Leishmania sp. Ghana 2012 LV757]
MQRAASHRGHAAPASSLVPWPLPTSCTFSCASSLAAQGSVSYGTAATSVVVALEGKDAAAQACFYAQRRGHGDITVLPRTGLQRTIRRLQSSRLLSSPFLITQQCTLYTPPPPPAPVESAPDDHGDGGAGFSEPLTSAVAMATDSASRRLVHRHRRAKRATAVGETPAASDGQRENEEAEPNRHHVRHASSHRRWRTGQPLSAAAPAQREPKPARQQECAPDAELAACRLLHLPAPPTREDATPESIVSYLLTLRRALNVNRTGAQPRMIARRAALIFMRQALPPLMTMPPVPQADMLTGMIAVTAAPGAATPSTTPKDGAAVAQKYVESGANDNRTDAALAGSCVGVCAHPAFPHALPRASPGLAREAFSVSSDAPWPPKGWGKGAVPWTKTLAESVLLMCNLLGLEVRGSWAARAALLYLVSDEAKDCADAPQQRPPTWSAIPSSLTRTPKSALNDKAQLALALMRTLDRNRRQSRLAREVLQPVAMRLAMRWRAKHNAAGSVNRLGGRGGAATPPHPELRMGDTSAAGVSGDDEFAARASFTPHAAATLRPKPRDCFVNLERYLAEALLPLLYGEFVHYCCTIEQWYDHNLRAGSAANAEATAASAASDARACLPKVSRSDIEALSLLAAVLHRALGLHGVVRRGDAIHFDLNECGADAYAAVAPFYREVASGPGVDLRPSADHLQGRRERSGGSATDATAAAAVGTPPGRKRPPLQPAVPLRAFRLTIEAIAAQLEAAGGPQTEELELALSRNQSRAASMGYAARARTLPPFVPPHAAGDASAASVLSDGSAGRSPPSPSSSASVSRFGRVTASSPARIPRAPWATAPCSSATRKEGGDGSEGHDGTTASSRSSRTTTTAAPPLPVRFGSFSVDSFAPILSLCGHDRSFRLLLTAAVHETGASVLTASPSGSVTPAGAMTGAMYSARVEEDVSALAAAISRLLLLGVYWAPLCRTYQLPIILAMFARATTTELTHAAQEKAALTVAATAAAAEASPHTASSPPTAAAPSTETAREAALVELDTEVLQRVRHTLLPPRDDFSTPSSPFVQQLHRLVYSSGRYMERVTFGTFVHIATMLDRVLSRWPVRDSAAAAAAAAATVASARSVSGSTDAERVFVKDGGEEGMCGGADTATASTVSSIFVPPSAATSGSPQSHDAAARTVGAASATDAASGSASHVKGPCTFFRAPAAAGMGTVTLFASIADEFWSRERGRGLWEFLARQARRSLTAASSATRTHRDRSSFLRLGLSKATHSVLRLAVPNCDGDGTEANYVREGLPVPFYVLRQMRVGVAACERVSTPDELLRAYETCERVESYMAVLNSAGCATAALPFIREYLRSDFMWRSIPNDAFAPLMTAVMELELTRMTVPELLLLSGSLEGSAGTKRGQNVSSSLQGRMNGCVSPHTALSLNARIEPHELQLLTAEDEDASTLCEKADPCRLRELLDTDSCHNDDKSALLRFTLRRISKDGRVLDPPPSSAATSRAAHPGAGGRGSAASSLTFRRARSQGVSGSRVTGRVFGEPACHACESVAEVLWESAYSRPSGEGARLPLAALPPLLRSMLLLVEAEGRVDDAASRDAADCRRTGPSRDSSTCDTGSGSLDTQSVENILRMAYRLLFGSGAEVAAAAAAPATVVPLEALVTLYLGLRSAAKQQTVLSRRRVFDALGASRKRTGTSPDAGERVCGSRSGTASLAPPPLPLSVNCCLAHCKTVLRPRLMAIALGTASSCAGDATYTEPESIATDLRVLLQLAVLTEGLLPCPATMAVPATAVADMSVDELIHRELFRELGASLREASLHQIAGEVSKLLWWVTRRAHAEAKGEGAAPLLPLNSWVETLLLQAVEAKRPPMAGCPTTAAGAASSASSCSSTTRRTFELFEWALLPLYTKLEARQQDAHTATVAADWAAAAPSQQGSAPAPLVDDFTRLEDAYSESPTGFAAGALSPQPSSQGLATGSPLGVTTHRAGIAVDARATGMAARGRPAAPHTAMLEAALNALPAQCDSFHILLHVVRQLFLSHPALLSTAPDAALYYELRTVCSAAGGEKGTTPTNPRDQALERAGGAAAGRQAWATLPVQRAELPRDLRERYVDTLFRVFKRLVRDCSCTAEELMELLHLLWLADPHASRVDSSVSSSPMASTSQWRSLFSRCSGFVKKSLDELHDAAALIDGNGDLSDEGSGAASSWAQYRSVPDVLQAVYRAVHYGLGHSILFKPLEMHWISVNAAVLHPRSVVLFLHCLSIVKELEDQQRQRASAPQPLSLTRLERRRQQQRAFHPLCPSHKGALELLQPFLIYTSITGERLSTVPKIRFMPLMLEALSEIDPPLVLALIQAVFSGAAGLWATGGGGGDGRRRSHNGPLAGKALYYAKILAGGQAGSGVVRGREGDHIQPPRTLLNGGWRDPHRLSESVAATMAALLMVASHAQASSAVWASDGRAEGHEDTDPAVVARATAKQAHIGRAHHRALIFLRNSLYQQLWTARSLRPLQCVSVLMVIQVMQLTVVQESPRLARILEWLALGLTVSPVARVEMTVLPAEANGLPLRESRLSAAPLPPLSASPAPGPALAALAHHDSDSDSTGSQQCGAAMAEETAAAKMRLTVTREGAVLLRLLPLQYWRSLLQRGVMWPRYRGYSLQLSLRSSRSLAVTRGETYTAGGVRDPAGRKMNELRESLASILLALDAESIAHLMAETMGPMMLLAVTTELLRVLARQRACSGDNLTTSRRNAEDDGARTVSATTRNAPRTNDRQLSTPDKAPAGTAEPRGVKDDPPWPEALASFEVVRRYASPGSLLTDEALQPWLKAACDVIDQLASTRHADFVAVLEREAAWQRRMTEASTYRGAATGEMPFGVYEQAAVGTVTATPGGTKHGAPEVVAPVLDVGEDGVAEVSNMGNADDERDGALLGADAGAAAASDDATTSRGSGRGVGEGDAVTTEFSTAADAKWSRDLDTAAEGPLVLDWRPISEFLRVVRQVDPGISQRQERLEWWLPAPRSRPFSPVTPVAGSGSRAEADVANQADDARDMLHNAVGVILQHARKYRQEAEQGHGVRPLLVMNLCDPLNLYPPDTQNFCVEGDGAAGGQPVNPAYEDGAAKGTSGTAVSAARDSTRDSAEGVEQTRWLEFGAGGIDGPATSFSSRATTVVLGLVRPCPALSISSARAATAAVEATRADKHMRRRLFLLRRAGVLVSVQEMAQRCSAYGLSAAVRCDDAEAQQRTRAASFWRRKLQRLRLEVLEYVFGGEDAAGAALVRSHASESGVAATAHSEATGEGAAAAAGRPVMDAPMSDVELRVRRRLQLLRCHDLAQLLLLMASASPSSSAKGGVHEGMHASSPLRQLQMRVVMDTMAELLPSASTGELMQVVLALLKLSVPAASTSATSTDGTTPQVLHNVRLEARRLLTNAAVLVANEAERFTLRELLWLITRLHTPCIRAAPAVAVASHARSSKQTRSGAATGCEERLTPAHITPLGNRPLDVSMSYVSAAVARAIRVAMEDSGSLADGQRDDDDADDDDGDDNDVCCDSAAGLDADVPASVQSASPVTVAQWTNAVAAAEMLQGRSQMQDLLRLVELSAV